MKNAKEIKKRIKSVKNIAKVTKTMELISTSRKRKVDQILRETEAYHLALNEVFDRVKRTNAKSLSEHALLANREVTESVAVVVIGPTKGYVGSLVSNQIFSLYSNLQKIKNANKDIQIVGISINKLGLKITKLSGIEDKFHFSSISEYPHYTELIPIYEVIRKGFTTFEYEKVFLSYTQAGTAIFRQLLPLDLTGLGQEVFNPEDASISKNPYSTYKEIYEPEVFTVVDYVLNEYFENVLLLALLSNNSAEHTARMATMRNASDNANSLGDNLQLNYNKARQEKITEELIEIAS